MTLDLFDYLDRAPQILIIDDLEDERLPLAEIFKFRNVIQCDGSHAREKFKNIRLVFLDLDLGDGFVPDNLVGTLYSYVVPTIQNGPFLLVLWTKHADKKEEVIASLEKYATKSDSAVTPFCIIALNKSEFQNADKSFKKDLLHETLKRELQNSKSIFSLIKWEHESVQAVYRTVEQLNSVACSPDDGVHNLDSLLEKLTNSVAGKHTEDIGSELFQKYLRESLGHILTDNIFNENSVVTSYDSGFDSDVIFNTLIQIATPQAGKVPPGSVFLINSIPCVASKLVIDNSGKSGKPWRAFISDFFGKYYSPNKDIILGSVLPIAVEITPPCDYSNNKRRMNRFAAGIAVPSPLSKEVLQHTDYLFSVNNIIYPDGHDYKVGTLCFNFRYIFSSLADNDSLSGAILMLRGHVFSDLQANLGKNISRPGHLSINIG